MIVEFEGGSGRKRSDKLPEQSVRQESPTRHGAMKAAGAAMLSQRRDRGVLRYGPALGGGLCGNLERVLGSWSGKARVVSSLIY